MCANNNWTLWSLARGGCSNFAIRLQVDKAIELQSDFVVIGTTTPDRGDFPIITKENSSVWEKLKNSFNWTEWFTSQPEVFVKSHGISNVLHTNSLSKTYNWIINPTIISESLNNLAFYGHKRLSKEQLDALRTYMLHLYDRGIKKQIDCWIISDACRKLDHANIPYLIFIESLYQSDFSNDISWVSEKNVVRPAEFSVLTDLPKSSAQFHYDIEQGSKTFANYVETRIKKHFND